MVKEKMQGIRLRGLRINVTEEQAKLSFCEAEFLILNDEGAINIGKVLHYFSKRVVFTSFKIAGDVHLNNFGNKNAFVVHVL